MFSISFKTRGGSPRAARLVAAILVVLVLAAAVSSAALAQTDHARLTVVVRDAASQRATPDDDLVPGVTVTLSGGREGDRTCTTVNGRCLFRVLDPGDYVLTVAGAAFETRTLTLTLTPGQRAVRVVWLTRMVPRGPGPPAAPGPTPSPEPTPDVAPLPQRNSPGRLGAGATREDAELLPNRGRSEEPVIDQLPGVTNAGGEAFSGFIFNGQPGSQNNERIADVDSNVTLVRSAASFQDPGAIFSNLADRRSIKTYSSFSVNTNNTPAKLGTGTGGQLVADISKGKAEGEAREWPIKGEVYEYLARDKFAARDFFDFAEKPSLSFDLFGLSLSGGPSFEKREDYPLFFFFANYEGIRASSDNTIFAAAPKLSLRERAAAPLAPLFDAFRAGGATLVDGGTEDQNFDILRLDSENRARKDAFTLRLDTAPSEEDSLSLIYIGSATRADFPDGVTGRRNVTRNISHTSILNYNRVITRDADGGKKMQNQVIVSFQSDPVRTFSLTPAGGPPDLLSGAVTIGGEVAPVGIEGQPLPLAVATLGALLPGSDSGRRLNFHPRKLSFADQLTWSGVDLNESIGSLGPLNFWRAGKHSFNFGGEMRFIRADIAQHYGTTYGYGSVDDFLANRATVTFSGDLGSLTGGETDAGRKASQEYFIAYAQDAWNIRSNMLLNYGLRYEYYSVLREARDRAFAVNPETGQPLPAGEPFYRSRRNNFLPRVAFAWAPNINGDLMEIKDGPYVISASFGMHVGPDVFDNLMRPILSDRVRASAEGAAFPAQSAALLANFIANPQNRRLRPLAIARGYTGPARVYKFDATYKQELVRRVVTSDTDNEDADVAQELFVTFSYVGNRSEGLLLRNFANPIVSVTPHSNPAAAAVVCRQFDIVCNEAETIRPYDEFEYLTTGGRADYDSLQVSLRGRARKFLRYFQADYTLARNRGNTDADSGIAAGNPLDYDYDYGYLAADVRHKFNFGALFFLDCGYLAVCNDSQSRLVKELTGGWKFAAIGTFQTGTPIDVRLTRPNVVYLDAEGRVHGSPAAGRQPVLNVPGGGASVAAYRPDLVPGVNPFLDGFGDRRFLNPAAFAIPDPGELGNLRRGELRGPGYRVVDVSLSKEVFVGSMEGLYKRKLTFNVDVTNVFNFTNFRLPPAKLNNVLGTDASQNQIQPGQPFTEAAAGTFGVITRTFKRKYDLGAGRQFQFGVSFKF
jgi:hypothetical protein